MRNAAQKYADRLIDAICECLHRCQGADDKADCAQEFVAQLRANPAWQQCDADRVERAVMRTVRPIEPAEFKQRA
jgi:hypothetical protein